MPHSNAFSRFPARIEVPNSLGGGLYVLRTDCYALKGGPRPPEPERLLFELEGGTTVVLRGQPSRDEQSRAVPVYEAPGGGLGVPTGRLFARFREGTSASAESPALRAAGFEIVDVPGWAPHTAWIQAAGGDLRTSLEDIDTLKDLSRLEHLEPQMLMRAARRR